MSLEPSHDDTLDLDLQAMLLAASFDGKPCTGFRYVNFPDILEIRDGRIWLNNKELERKLCSVTETSFGPVKEYEVQLPDNNLIIKIDVVEHLK
jgi:hypothetical protein